VSFFLPFSGFRQNFSNLYICFQRRIGLIREYIVGTKKKAVREMDHFNRLVSEQLVTMEKLLYLQGEIERCQQIEVELQTLQKETDLESIQNEIVLMKLELKEIQSIFEKQTEEVIDSYREMNLTPSF
jgi:hypothetical protein